MVTVSPDPVRVESELVGGLLSCPSCEVGVLGPWGWARERLVGRGGSGRRVVPRRSRCRWCRTTHVLLPATMLLRRGEWAATIGRAVELRAQGWGWRPIAARLGLARSTVRGWLSRLVEVAERVRSHVTRWAYWLDPGLVRIEPSSSVVGDVVAAVGAVGEAASRRGGSGGRWQFASAATGGRLLCNTTSPFPAPWTG